MNCTNRKCRKKTFMEPLSFARPYGRMTDEVKSRIKAEALCQPSRLACESLSRQHIHTSPSTCQRMARAMGGENPRDVVSSGYVAIDDLAYRKGRVYMCAIADHQTRRVLALFGSRYGEEIGEWLKSHPEIRLVSRDGSRQYASIVKSALPEAEQVSDHFHLVKCLGDTMVEAIQKMLHQARNTLPYPYPSEYEARECIMEELYEMGNARHRKLVRDYFAARRMQEEGCTIKEMAERMDVRSHVIYKLINTNMKKILSNDQVEILHNAPELARIISCGTITPVTIAKKMEGRLCCRLVKRATRKLRKRYTKLRHQVRMHNKDPKNAKGVKVKAQTIRSYIMTGKTTSEKLQGLKHTHPNIDKIIQACISFTMMIDGKDDAPDMETWLQMADECHNAKLSNFAQYVRRDKEAIANTYLKKYSNGFMEGTVNKIKAIKRSMFNRAGIELLRAKAIYGGYHPLN